MATAQVSREPSFGFPPKGSLRRVPFPRLIREVARHKLDGSLYLLSGQTKKVVFFEQGQPVFVRSNVLSECLGQILAKEGLITQEQCEQTLEAIRRTGKKQGELLVEMGILSEGNLRYGLEAQLRAKLFEIFSWQEGRYQFKNDASGMNFGVTLRASAEGVIVEAIQDQYPQERATEALDAASGKYPVVIEQTADVAAPSLLPEERHFLACLDGSRTVSELLATQPDPPVPTLSALLYGLWVAGLVEMADEAAEAQAPPPAPDLSPRGGSDADLRPSFEAQAHVTEYEDTPLPGQLPQSPDLLGDHEDGFEGVGEDSAVMRVGNLLPQRAEVPEALVAAEPPSIDETFDDDQLELPDGDLDLDFEVDDDLADFAADQPGSDEPEAVAPEPIVQPQPIESEPEPPSAVEPALLAAPEPVAPPQAIQPEPELAPEPAENVLLGLEPDDDLLMADPGLEDMALDLVGEHDPLAEPGAPMSPQLEGIESIEPMSLDDDDDAEPLDDDIVEVLEVEPDDLEIEEVDDEPEPPAALAADEDDSLMGLDDLDAIDLGGDEDEDADADGPDVEGALRFNEGQTAMADERWDDAIAHFDEAYNGGFDVAELHAMVAYARFSGSAHDDETVAHVFELLDYAQQMDPSLDLVHAYRGSIYRTLDDLPKARKALDRALELNPYCELAMEILDEIG